MVKIDGMCVQARRGLAPCTFAGGSSVLARTVSRCRVALIAIVIEFVIALAPVSLRAQSLRGTVLLPDSVTAAAGVIVQASDARGAILQRTLSDVRGHFALTFSMTVSAAAPIELRLLRIGFAPTVLHGVRVAERAVAPLIIVLGAERVQLARVTVRGEDVCRMDASDGREVARVWEEARKAMLASQLAEMEPLLAEWVEYQRELDTLGGVVRSQRMQAVQKPTLHAFRSAPAEQLAARGYVERENDGTTYRAPDLDVLLSESFAAIHCFHLEPASGSKAGMIGVGFRPAKSRGAIIDIEGTFWIDQTTNELRTLEYRYTNIPDAASRAGAGGAVEFQRIPTGSWLVSRWHIRMPQYSTRSQVVRAISITRASMGMSVTGAVSEISGLAVTGAQVTRVARGDTGLFSVTGNQLRMQLVSHDTGARFRGSTVALVGTEHIGQADDLGSVRIGPILAGRYRAALSTPVMDSLGVQPIEREIEISDDSTRVESVEMPTGEEMLRTACSADVAKRGLAHIRGVVRDSAGNGIARLPLTLTWIQNVSLVDSRLLWMEQSRNARTDDAGAWHLCGAPREALITVRIASSSVRGEGNTRLATHEPFGTVDVRATVLSAALLATDGLRGSAIAEFTVTDADHRPLPDALLDVLVAKGKSRLIRADSTGVVLVPGLDAGSLRVRARQLGYAAGELTVMIAPGRNTVPIILDRVRPPTLDTIRVLGNATVLTRHEEFENRRRRGDATAVVTRAEIEARNPVSTWQLLTRLTSVMVVDSADKKVVRTSRRMSIPCVVRIGVNGTLLAESEPDVRNLPPPSEVHGIEVFSGISTAPVQYGAHFTDVPMCGLVMVWTR